MVWQCKEATCTPGLDICFLAEQACSCIAINKIRSQMMVCIETDLIDRKLSKALDYCLIWQQKLFLLSRLTFSKTPILFLNDY
jgi:hypothetical protein